MGRAAIEGSLGRLADVRGRVEVGLADLEVDDRPAGGLERAGSGRGFEGGLGADARHSFCELHRVSSCGSIGGDSRWPTTLGEDGSAISTGQVQLAHLIMKEI
jgi:hypothetical protein